MEMDINQSNDYIQVLYENLEACRQADKVLPFRVVEMKKTGFKVKVGGLFAFVPFQLMPWQYNNNAFWEAVSPHLQGKRFFCKVERIEHDPRRVFIDSSVHCFQPASFEEGEAYEALVIFRAGYGLFLDLGFHFGWRSGSHVAMAHGSMLKRQGLDWEAIQPGDRMWVRYAGIDDQGRVQLVQPERDTGFDPQRYEAMVGQVVPVQVSWDEASGRPKFVVHGKLDGRMPMIKRHYPGGKMLRKAVWATLYDLPVGSTIRCEVTGVSTRRGGGLVLRWVASDLPGWQEEE
jgi:hypothetical protein